MLHTHNLSSFLIEFVFLSLLLLLLSSSSVVFVYECGSIKKLCIIHPLVYGRARMYGIECCVCCSRLINGYYIILQRFFYNNNSTIISSHVCMSVSFRLCYVSLVRLVVCYALSARSLTRSRTHTHKHTHRCTNSYRGI